MESALYTERERVGRLIQGWKSERAGAGRGGPGDWHRCSAFDVELGNTATGPVKGGHGRLGQDHLSVPEFPSQWQRLSCGLDLACLLASLASDQLIESLVPCFCLSFLGDKLGELGELGPHAGRRVTSRKVTGQKESQRQDKGGGDGGHDDDDDDGSHI